MRRKIIIDTDPGQDDAIALLLAFGSVDELDILGVVTVAGNAELSDTLSNAQRVCELADPSGTLGIPVLRGSGAPLARKLVTCQGFHGPNGLAGVDLPPPRRPLDLRPGVAFLIETLEARADRSITICTLGPMTNLAKVLRMKPHLAGHIGELVMMGGAYLPHGNISPAAEFNMHVDPEAASLVITALSDWGVPITMMPLDVTHKTAIGAADIQRLRNIGNRCGVFAADVLASWGERPHYQAFEGVPLHDPCVIAYLVAPALFSGQKVNVEVETQGRWTSGMTVVDWWAESGRGANVTFITDVDSPGYVRLLEERIARLP